LWYNGIVSSKGKTRFQRSEKMRYTVAVEHGRLRYTMEVYAESAVAAMLLVEATGLTVLWVE